MTDDARCEMSRPKVWSRMPGAGNRVERKLSPFRAHR